MKAMWFVAGLSAMIAALATWLIGFMQPAEAFITTTIALIMGVGGFWMADHRRRRWGVIFTAAMLILSMFVKNGASGYALWRFPFGATSLCFALIASVTRDRPRRDPDEAEQLDGESDER